MDNLQAISGLADDMGTFCSEQATPYHPAALDNFTRIFAIEPNDKVVLLLDRDLDPKVTKFIWDFARGRGASVEAFTIEKAGIDTIPEVSKPIIERATFLVSTWFPSVMDPYLMALRRDLGQRWVKITYFRNLDLLRSSAARFPLPVISKLLQETASAFQKDREAEIVCTDPRGTDLRIVITPEMVGKILGASRWRGELTADKPGAYVHYLPTHGPNFFDNTLSSEFNPRVDGVIRPQAAIGFDTMLGDDIEIEVRQNRVVRVSGKATECAELERMLDQSCLIELGCGFNPKFPRYQIYPAGSNSPGAVHFGFDFPKQSEFLRRHLPNWPEPPVHQDLVSFDATVTVNGKIVVRGGFLEALRSEAVRSIAERFGDPVNVLEKWPMSAADCL